MARAGNAIAVQGQIEAAMLRTGRAAATQTRQLGAMGNQMKALGTTIRYALAGSIVFGIAGLVGKLDKLQQQLGLISAIGPTAGINFDNTGLSNYLTEVEQKAVAARTPVNEINDSVINFLSTVQGAPKGQLVDIVSQIGITAKLSQTPTEDLTKAVSTLNIAAGRTNNLKNVNSLLREWFHLISTAPGGIAAAPQIAQQLGPLAAVSIGLGRETPEQMLAIASGALKFGATPSVALRGAQYFQQSLFQPTSKQARAALAGAGLTPRRLQAEGGAAFTLDFLKHLESLGDRGQKKLTRAQVQKFGVMVDANPDTEAALAPNQNIPGLSPAQQRFLRTSVGRIHGIRTAVVLLQQLQTHPGVQSIEELFKVYDRLNKGIGKDAAELSRAEERYRAQTPLRAAAVAVDALSTQIQTALAPAINVVAAPITSAQGFLARHPHGTKIGIQAGAGAIAAAGMLRLLTGAKFGLGGKLFGRAGQTIVAEQAISALSHAGGPQGSSPANPLYVTVVGQLFGGSGAGSSGNWKDPLTKAGGTGAGAAAARGIGLSRLAAGVGAAALITLYESKSSQNMGELEKKNLRTLDLFPQLQRGYAKQYGYMKGKPSLAQQIALMNSFNDTGTVNIERAGISSAFLNVAGGRVPFGRLSPQTQRQVSPLLQKLAQEQMKGLVGNVGNVFQSIDKAFAKPSRTEVTGSVDVGIKVTDPNGKQKDARVHVPLSTIHDGGSVPSSRGKRKSMRVDFTVGGTDLRVGGKP